APEESVDSYVLSAEYVPGELYVCLVGTRRRARRRGAASLLLCEVLSAAKEAGYRTASLGVDAESATQGVRLYERVGFRRVRTDVVYEKPLEALCEAC
ncbi:MAG: GNAT family N-acetyltransferase, partial [Sinomonas sp.]|nr:GNAT family N-acetyltransferase [Sinomonas sp.]